ncbi:MAG TPA: ABC transporter permease, partial [Longimicrobiales bacterium]|nr:ABC transporter permease [Longimicrobiales bacterium]
MPMAWGRTPTAREAEAGGAGVVVARGLWERLVGGPPRAGSVLRVSGTPREVTGVVSSGAEYPPGTELWLPVHPTRGSGGMRNNINWYAVGRLAEGASMEEARRDLSGIALGIRDTDPEAIYSFGVGVTPLRDFVVGGTSTWLWLLMGGATVVLLVACVNLAALNVGRAAAEWRASAVRRALGAGRARLVRQHATRHILLACVGGGLGVLGAHVGIGALLAAADLPLPRVAGVALDTRIAFFGIAVSLVAGLLAGLVPALRASTASLRAGGGRSRGGHSTRRTGSALVGLELALAVVLVTAAALVVRDLRSLLDRGLGFDPAGIVTARTSLVEDEYRDPERRSTYWLRVGDAVRALPGVESAAVSSTVPAGTRGTGFIEVEGWTGPTTGASYQTAGEGYFRTLSIRLLEGRSFGPRDAGGTERVVVVNRALAERYWLGESALGRRIRALSMEGIGPDPAPWLTVIGVVEDIRHHGFRSDPRPEMYVDFRQAPAYWMGNLSVVAKTRESGEA